VYLIANAAQTLARWDSAERAKGPLSKLERLPTEKLSPEAGHDDSAKIENGAPDLHREVDTQDLVFAEVEALSTRAVAPPPGKHFSNGCLPELSAISNLQD
jgi:hypothetical protein